MKLSYIYLSVFILNALLYVYLFFFVDFAQKRVKQIKGMESGVTHLSMGAYYSCAVQNQQMKCWDYDEKKSLGKIQPRLIKGIGLE